MEDRGVVISTKEIYTTMLRLNENIIVLNQNVEELQKIRAELAQRAASCDKKFLKYNSVSAQVKVIWAFVSGIILAIINIFLQGVSKS